MDLGDSVREQRKKKKKSLADVLIVAVVLLNLTAITRQVLDLPFSQQYLP